MAIHVLEEQVFFKTSVPIGDQQRIVFAPRSKSVSPGDEIYLRDGQGQLSWVADVLMVGETGATATWEGRDEPQVYMIIGWLARIHPGTFPDGRAKLQAPWVTLNSRTIETAMPWREAGVLVYHSTMRLIEGVLTKEEVARAEKLGLVAAHRSGHYCVPTSEVRKRILVQVKGEPLVCQLCGAAIASLDEATHDHRIPVSQGGPDILANIQLAHRVCNEFKGNALPEQYPPMFLPPSALPSRFQSERHFRRRRKFEVREHLPTLKPPVPPSSTNGSSGQILNGAAMMADKLEQGPRAAAPVAKPAPTKIEPAPTAVPSPAAAKAAAVVEPVAGQSKGRGKRRVAKSADSKNQGSGEVAVTAKAEAHSVDTTAPTSKSASKPATGTPTDAPAGEKKASRRKKTASVAPAAATTKEVQTASSESPTAEVAEPTAELEAWLRSVQASGWSNFASLAGQKDWAARTAILRTMEQVRRNLAPSALGEGTPVSRSEGPKGTYALLSWKNQFVLVEEVGGQVQSYLVRMLDCLAPHVYTWYLSQFGRTTPLAVAMALLQLWQQAAPDALGRATVKRGDELLSIQVAGDRIVEIGLTQGGTEVA